MVAVLSLDAVVVFAQTAAAPYEDEEAYAVYSSILPEKWQIRVAKAKRLVIQMETGGYPHFRNDNEICLKPAEGEEHIYGPAISAYEDLNKKTWQLQRKFDSQVPYELVSKESIERIFADKGTDAWKAFYDKYPDSGGMIVMSAVGFNRDRTIAVVYMGHACGDLCGGGTYHIMKKNAGKWSRVEWKGSSCAWAS